MINCANSHIQTLRVRLTFAKVTKYKCLERNGYTVVMCRLKTSVSYMCILTFVEKNGLSFIETSALDSTNVENAFQNILTGGCVYGYVVGLKGLT